MKTNLLRRSFPAIALVAFCGSCVALAAQAAAAPQPPTEAPPQRVVPSSLMQPSLEMLQQTLGGLHPEKWKTSDEARQETIANLDSIRRDLETTLPPLLTAADSAPGSVSQLLPAYRNIEALYDVLLRVVEIGNISAPRSQSTALERARQTLEEDRRALGDHLKSAALTEEQQVRSLQAALRAVPPAPAPVVCPPPPAKKRTRRRKPAAKSTAKPATSSTKQQSSTPSH
jgi:hypothetical protein